MELLEVAVAYLEEMRFTTLQAPDGLAALEVIAAIQAGANGYILKPFTRRTFEAKVTEALAHLPGPFI